MNIQQARSILNVSDQADLNQIKSAYRSLSKQKHPDTSTGSEKDFEELKKAYDLISEFYQNSSNLDFSSQVKSKRAIQAQSINMEVSLEQVFSGAKVQTDATGEKICSKCMGTGKIKLKNPQKCATCNGDGEVKSTRGMLRFRTPCGDCKGKGVQEFIKCTHCSGLGIIAAQETLEFNLPIGLNSGDSILINSPNGQEIEVVFFVKDHLVWTRKQNNLICSVKINMPEACLGTQKQIKTIDNKNVIVKVDPGTQNNSYITFSDLGMIDESGKRGKLIVKITVLIPETLSVEQQNFLQKWLLDLDNVNYL